MTPINHPHNRGSAAAQSPGSTQSTRRNKSYSKKSKHHFDQHTKHLPASDKGDQIRVRMGNHWEPGVVVDHAETPRSYKIQANNGGEYRRNRKMLMKLPDSVPLSTDNSPLEDPPSARVNGNSPGKEQVNQATPVAQEHVSAFQEQESNSSADGHKETEQYKTRSGRVIQRPSRFKDYV